MGFEPALTELLRAFPGSVSGTRDPSSLTALLYAAEAHGVSGVVEEALGDAASALPAALRATLQARAVARELDHEAHLALLARIDRALEAHGLEAAVLKGPLLARRYYPRPSARATTDVDLLVRESDLAAAGEALGTLGYRPSDAPDEARFRAEHHHLHLTHGAALPLELHFHAYRGFGVTLRSDELLARAVTPDSSSFRALRVLAPDDELAYLAVHAAAHRFVRLGWLFDMKLAVSALPEEALVAAARRAHAWGTSRTLAWSAALLRDVLGVSESRLAPLGHVDAIREPLLRGITFEPSHAVLRSATRFVYSALLCDSAPAALRYARAASRDYARRVLPIARNS